MFSWQSLAGNEILGENSVLRGQCLANNLKFSNAQQSILGCSIFAAIVANLVRAIPMSVNHDIGYCTMQVKAKTLKLNQKEIGLPP